MWWRVQMVRLVVAQESSYIVTLMPFLLLLKPSTMALMTPPLSSSALTPNKDVDEV